MVITKFKKRKYNLLIPKRCNHGLIIPNYNNLGFNLIIPKNNDYDIILSHIYL